MKAHIQQKQLFDFNGREHCEQALIKTFEEFQYELANGLYRYDDINEALKHTFLRVFDNMFYANKQDKYFEKKISDMDAYHYCRGAILREEENVGYERFEPKAKFMTKGNRFSPKGIEWLYIAIGECENESYDCSLAECCAKSSDRFASVKYAWSTVCYTRKIVDLTIAGDFTYEDINNELNLQVNLAVKHAVDLSLATMAIQETPQEIREYILKWYRLTYAKIMSEQLFVPIEGAGDSDLMYAPFQCLAQYFKSLGYCGIVYDSAVYKKGKNLVLFDKTLMSPTGKIREVVLT